MAFTLFDERKSRYEEKVEIIDRVYYLKLLFMYLHMYVSASTQFDINLIKL